VFRLACALLMISSVALAGAAQKEPPAKVTPELRKKLRARILGYVEPPPLDAAARKKLERLVKDLSSDSFKVREAASQGLVAFGQQALPRLRAAAKSSDPEVSERAGVAIERINEDDREYRLVVELRKTKAESLAVLDELVREREADLKKAEGAGRELKGRELVEHKTKVGNLKERLGVLKTLRQRVATKDYLEEAVALLKKGKDAEAEKVLQAFIKKPGADAAKVAKVRSALNIVRMLKRHAGNPGTRDALVRHITLTLGVK
jgi:hypothetical protein